MSKPTFELSSAPPAPHVDVRRGTGKPRFLSDLSAQLDPLRGSPAALVPEGHLARNVLSMVGQLDLSPLERQYSSLGRRGLHPLRKLAVLVYASLTGLHEVTKIVAASKTDAAYRLLTGDQPISETMMRTFRRENAKFFADAIAQTVMLAAAADLIDREDLAVDSVRIQADASTKSIRTRKRSEERLEELRAVDPGTLNETARALHAEKVKKHDEALRRCAEEDRPSHSITTPSAALMKFPNGAALPGHRVTVVAAGVRLRFVIAVLIGSGATDVNLLRPITEAARSNLAKAGVEGKLQMAGDAGFLGQDDLQYAIDQRGVVDILLNDPPQPRRGKSKLKGGFFSKAEFDFRADGTVWCPSNKPMRGPAKAGAGKVRWRGVGCESCPLKPSCTSVKVREVIVDPERERLHGAMRTRMAEDGAKERYRRRIATVEPVFSYIEDTMGFKRASSRHTEAVRGEIFLKILAYNLYRLFFCPSDQVALVEGKFDGQRLQTSSVRLVRAADLLTEWSAHA